MAKNQTPHQVLPVEKLELNKGQVYGLPANPRFIKDERFEALKQSITDAPEMLEARTLLVYPMENGNYIVIGGNMRLRACLELGFTELPCYVFKKETPVQKLREYTIKDNVAFGQLDWDNLANEWEVEELQNWGLECDFLKADDGGVWDELDTVEGDPKKPELEKPLKIEIVVPVEIKEQEEQIREAVINAVSEFEGCEVK